MFTIFFIYSILVLISIFTILIWIATGGALASTIVLSDVCIDPDGLIRNQTNNEPFAKGTRIIKLLVLLALLVFLEIVNYFISCEPGCRPNVRLLFVCLFLFFIIFVGNQ